MTALDQATVRTLFVFRSPRVLKVDGFATDELDDAVYIEVERAWPALKELPLGTGFGTKSAVLLASMEALVALLVHFHGCVCFETRWTRGWAFLAQANRKMGMGSRGGESVDQVSG